jgi:Family of unknown function (DUF6644)
MLAPLFARIEASGIATTIGTSVLLTGVLSGLHLIGLTLLVGAVIVSTLRLFGVVLAGQPVAEVTVAARRAIVLALGVNVTTGLLLLSPRISTASQNYIFQLKMLLLGAAAVFHFACYRGVASGRIGTRLSPRGAGAIGLMLWSGVVLAGCAFILIE